MRAMCAKLERSARRLKGRRRHRAKCGEMTKNSNHLLGVVAWRAFFFQKHGEHLYVRHHNELLFWKIQENLLGPQFGGICVRLGIYSRYCRMQNNVDTQG